MPFTPAAGRRRGDPLVGVDGDLIMMNVMTIRLFRSENSSLHHPASGVENLTDEPKINHEKKINHQTCFFTFGLFRITS